ncbi:sensor domain-containing diguanylate cyclase [Pseudomonas sp. LA21]|uniref:sensor domain-containing diguanylate cyclase n=1 Tax=unclassified Pseudomonas TaxID=196821 RepID=UPI001FB702A9|nr:sensor domain-containing diguanylate cyclase [Pseudomonas sp. LA21]MCJ1884177.1 sensor domain-containing diguanylate cyclase [Pseudomonas sp. LA21]
MKRDIRLAVLLLTVISLTVAMATAWELWAARERTLAKAYTHNLNLTQALDTYVEGIITQSSMLLLGLAERLETDGTTPAQLERLRHLAQRQQSLLNQLDGIVIYDANGNWLMVSNGNVPAGATSADRSFFIHHRDNPSTDAYIGEPIRSRSSGKWVITVSRRYNHPDGRFAGVISATLGVENFLQLFGKIDIGQHGAIGVTTSNGQVLVRYPFRQADMGRVLSRSPIFTGYLDHAMVGTASFNSSLDGIERIYAFRKNERYPLVTAVALGKDEALASWRADAMRTVAIAVGLLLVIVIIGILMILAIQRRIRTEGLLVAAREELLKANHQLEVLASRDPLTGLQNRRSFDDRLTAELRRAYREQSPLSLLLIDVDYFKRFNDTYGHPAGDDCLRNIGQLLADSVRRPGDLAARYGGEELAVILPNTDNAGAQAVAEQFLQHLWQSNLTHVGSPFGRVTASIGIATLPAGSDAPAAALIGTADQALYRAKGAGRNRLDNASSLSGSAP